MKLYQKSSISSFLAVHNKTLMDYTVSKMRRLGGNNGGFTLVELMVTMLVIGIVSASMIVLFISLVHSAVIAKRQAVASSLATNQMEYLHSLP